MDTPWETTSDRVVPKPQTQTLKQLSTAHLDTSKEKLQVADHEDQEDGEAGEDVIGDGAPHHPASLELLVVDVHPVVPGDGAADHEEDHGSQRHDGVLDAEDEAEEDGEGIRWHLQPKASKRSSAPCALCSMSLLEGLG